MTAHKPECSRVWKRYDLTCPRCQELTKGARPRPGWSDTRRQMDAQRIDEIKAHDFAACAKRNIVCTCFDW